VLVPLNHSDYTAVLVQGIIPALKTSHAIYCAPIMLLDLRRLLAVIRILSSTWVGVEIRICHRWLELWELRFKMLGDYANESMFLFVSIHFIRSPLATSSWNDVLYYLPEHLSVQEPTLVRKSILS
jgi:hypothetical protein